MITETNKLKDYLEMEFGFIQDTGTTLVAISPGVDIIYNTDTTETSFISKEGTSKEPLSIRTLVKLNRLIKL